MQIKSMISYGVYDDNNLENAKFICNSNELTTLWFIKDVARRAAAQSLLDNELKPYSNDHTSVEVTMDSNGCIDGIAVKTKDGVIHNIHSDRVYNVEKVLVNITNDVFHNLYGKDIKNVIKDGKKQITNRATIYFSDNSNN